MYIPYPTRPVYVHLSLQSSLLRWTLGGRRLMNVQRHVHFPCGASIKTRVILEIRGGRDVGFGTYQRVATSRFHIALVALHLHELMSLFGLLFKAS